MSDPAAFAVIFDRTPPDSIATRAAALPSWDDALDALDTGPTLHPRM